MQRTVYPVTRVTRQRNDQPPFVIENFKTIDKKTREDALPLEIGTVAQNLRYDSKLGEISKRANRAKYGSMTTLGIYPIIFGDRYYNTYAGSAEQIIAYSTTILVGDDAAGSFSELFTELEADVHKRSLTYKDVWYFCDLINTSGAYDGTNAEDMGVPVPTAPSGVDSTDPGQPDGTYYYKITYELDGYQEGNASVASDEVIVVTNAITVTIPKSTNGRCTARILYRTKDSGSTYYYVAKIDNNDDVSYTDDIHDDNLDTTREAPSDYGAPPKFKYMILQKERIFGFRTDNDNGDSELVWSDIRAGTSYPDVFPAANTQPIAPDDGDVGKDIILDNFGQFIIFKLNGIYKYNTDTDDPVGWTLSERLSPHGSAANNVVKTPQGVFFIAKYGELKKRLMLWNGSSAKSVFEELEPILTAVINTKVPDIKLHYHNGYLYITYCDTAAGDLFNNRVITIDLTGGGWQIDKKNVAHFWSWLGAGDRGELYSGSSDTAGFVYREDTANYDIQIKLKSELDLGTFNQVETKGTEQAPTLNLIESELDDDVGEKTWEDLYGDSDTWENYNDDLDTWWPSGLYISDILLVNAVNLLKIFWTEVKSGDTDVLFWVRTGDTRDEVAAASWSGPYTDPTGADISGVTAKIYIQYKAQLFTKVITDAALVYLKRGDVPNDYVVKITAGLGLRAESAIEMIWESGFMDFGFKRRRKRMKQVKIEFRRLEASGTLTYGYYLDNATGRTANVDIDLATYASQGYYIHKFPLGTYGVNLKHRLYNSDIDALSIKRLTYLVSVEPLHAGL